MLSLNYFTDDEQDSKAKKRLKSFILNFILGGLLILALAPFYVFPLLILALSGLLWQIASAKNLKAALWRSFSFGVGYYMIGLFWIGFAFLDFPEPSNPNRLLGISLAIPAMIAISTFLGLYFILLGFLSWRAPKKGLRGAVVQASIWTLVSFLQGHLFTGFPWNPLAISLTFHPITMQPAAFVGVYGLSWIAAFIGYSLYCFKGQFKSEGFTFACRGLLVVFALSSVRYIYYDIQLKSAPKIAKIRGIQTGISLKDKWDVKQFYSHLALVEDMLKQGDADYDAAILGETALPILIDQDTQVRELLGSYIPANSNLLIGANQLTDGDYSKPRNTLVALSPQGEILYSYTKTHLVPFGEYSPWWAPFGKFISVPGHYVRGDGPETYQLKKFSYGPNICYEGIFTGDVIDYNNKPDVMINVAIDGWYGNTHGPRQHAAQQQLRAVEEGIPLIRVTDNGISYGVNALGKIEKRIGINTSSYFDYEVKKKNIVNLAWRYSEFLLFLTMIIIVLSQKSYPIRVENKK
ncbi:MAG: apolipoprotein N-acyltransferase [Alphaproteobacteria bacterium]